MEIEDVTQLDLSNPDYEKLWEDPYEVPNLIVETCRNPEYMHFFIKYILNFEAIFPYQTAILDTLWHKPFPMLIATRGGSKSLLLAVYTIMRAVLHQGSKIVVIGASLRQSLVIFNYIAQIFDNAPILRDIVGYKNSPKNNPQMAYWNCGNSKVSFLPLGDGTTIRGQRATHIIVDETASIDPMIFDTVIRGFAATKSDGVAQHVIKKFKDREMKRLNIIEEKTQKEIDYRIPTILGSNQIVLAGTAYYQFNHFYKKYKNYESIILSGGKPKQEKDSSITIDYDNVNVSDYAIIRLPYTFITEMMDETVMNQAKMTMDRSIFEMEYLCRWVSDSEGFYLASALNAATSPVNDIVFGPRLYGDQQLSYVMGIDPASESDSFALNIIELNEGKRRIVYQWSTNRKNYEKLKADNKVAEDINDYNTFFIRHIRDLLKRFNIALICMDSGGGGISIRELLKDKEKCKSGDDLIIDVDDENQNLAGRRILKMIEFNNYQWRRDSHYGLRTDIINKSIMFPAYDAAEAEVDAFHSDRSGRMIDRLDDCYNEMLELKSEITLIRLESTPTGQEKWDVPKVVGTDSNNIRKKLKKDRFTSLLLSNWAARLVLEDTLVYVPTGNVGGLARRTSEVSSGQPYYGKGFNKMKNSHVSFVNSNPITHPSANGNIFY